MNPKYLIACGVALLLAVAGYFIIGGGSEQDAINKQLDALVSTLEEGASAAQLKALASAQGASKKFTKDCSVEARNVRINVNDQQELAGAFASALSTLDDLSVRITRRAITMSADERSATMQLNATVTGTAAGAKENGSGEYTLEWVKIDSEWLIQRVLAVDL